MKIDELPTDDQIREAFEGTNFGPGADPVKILKNGILSVCCGYHTGRTLTNIMEYLGLVRVVQKPRELRLTITERGRTACYAWFAIKNDRVSTDDVVGKQPDVSDDQPREVEEVHGGS